MEACASSSSQATEQEEEEDFDGSSSGDEGSASSECSSIDEGLTTELRRSRHEVIDELVTEDEIRAEMARLALEEEDDSSDSDESDRGVDEPNSLPQLRLYNVNAEPRILGGRRAKGDVRRGTQVGRHCYGAGILLPDNYIQPVDSTLRPLKIVAADHDWVKEPQREERAVEFDLGRQPRLLKFDADATVLEMFLSLWNEPSEIWRKNTNKKGREISAKQKKKGKKWTWRDVTVEEGYAFVAALMRLDVQIKPTLKEYWSRDLMTRDEFMLKLSETCRLSFRRFSKIMLATRLHDKKAAMRCGASDKTSPRYDTQHKVRDFFDAANRSFQDHREAGSNVAVDESMSKFTGRCSFLQSMPRKPIKKGIKHYYLCESEDGYVYRFLMHTTQSLPYSAEFGYILAIVMCLLDGLVCKDLRTLLDCGRTVYVDRFYSSIPLAKALLDRNTYIVGTIKLGMKNMPNLTEERDGVEVSVIAPQRFSRGATLFRHSNDGDMTVSYWLDSQLVVILSTYPAIVTDMGTCERRMPGNRTKRTFPRPVIAKLFDEKMGGVDICDQQIAAQRRQKRTQFWFTSMLFRIIDLDCINVYAIKKHAGAKISMLAIKTQLAFQLMELAKEKQPWRPRPIWTMAKEEIEKNRQTNAHTPKHVVATERRVCKMCKLSLGNTHCYECQCILHDGLCWWKYHNDTA